MTSRASSRTPSDGSLASSIGPAGARIACLACTLALLCGPVLAAAPAAAAKVCGERAKILEQLEQKHEETPQALGLSADGGVLEVLVAPDGGWTILVTYPKRPTCVVAIGEGWQSLTTLVGQEA